MRTTAVRVTVLAVVLGLVACGGGSDAGGEGGQDGEASAADVRAPHLGQPGEAIADGLVVPPGAVLLGRAFSGPGPYASAPEADGAADEQVGTDPTVPVSDSWTAYLEVDGDPFAAFDDLAEQLRSGPPSVDMPGTADSCVWESRGGDELTVEEMIVAESDRPDDAESMVCQGSAAEADGRQHRYSLDLEVREGRPTMLTVMSSERPSGLPPVPFGSAAMLRWQTSGEPVERLESGPEPVPADRASQLPETGAVPTVAAGEPVGGEVNCFWGTGYSRFELPDGATFLGADPEAHEFVLAVDDVDAVLASLEAQVFAGSDLEPRGASSVATIQLEEGTARQWSNSVDAGGGACAALSSPDGKYLVLTLSPD